MGYKEMPEALKVPDLTPVQKLVLLAATAHANREKGGVMWHGQGSIAHELGVSRETVNRAYKALEQRGLISRRPQYRETAAGRIERSTDLVTVHFDAFVGATDPQGVVTTDHGGSDERSLGVVTTDHRGSDEKSQQNREVNREEEQVNQSGTEFHGPSSASTPSAPVDKRRGPILDVIQRVANTPDGNYQEPMADLFDVIAHHYTEELADFLDTWTVPAKCADRYEAGKWLNKFLNTARVDGVPLEDRDHLEDERAKQQRALEALMKGVAA